MKKKKQQNMDEIDKATTEDSIEIKTFTLPTVPSEDEIKKRNRQNKEIFMQTKMEIEKNLHTIKLIDQPDIDAIEIIG